MSHTLGDRFPAELERVRTLLQDYRDLGGVGVFGVTMIEAVLTPAEKAWAEQDTVAMIRLYPKLQGCQ